MTRGTRHLAAAAVVAVVAAAAEVAEVGGGGGGGGGGAEVAVEAAAPLPDLDRGHHERVGRAVVPGTSRYC